MPRGERIHSIKGSPEKRRGKHNMEKLEREDHSSGHREDGKQCASSVEQPKGIRKCPCKREREPPDADILHGSFIASDLQTRMDTIYTHMVRRMLPTQSKFISEAGIMEEADGATLTFEVQNKGAAIAMRDRLQNTVVCGRQWKVEIFPLKETQCSKEACLVDVLLVPPAPRTLVLRALNGAKGFLSLVDVEDTVIATPVSVPTERESVDSEIDSNRSFPLDPSFNEATNGNNGAVDLEERVLASFVDEGSAQNARAVLSGRLIGTSGVRMFLERHR
ncbi:uncharacterized protein TEOVI_000033700 [Trypanosoma equiperdum]|uniref:Uncharacterized protein n=2 Tax=Trypanozoon TaxID=39700 RepID=Q38FU7_TRYB2|nr:hypothetical protein, conserved [Trypanosoma brucei brucei TREU927]EAN76323.1 hypothetical protein, conserved [Trypanosoma brucei brucei TREU927]SCU66825.1 hypothetical protein, conserved [Trypanosoma equiperdum]